MILDLAQCPLRGQSAPGSPNPLKFLEPQLGKTPAWTLSQASSTGTQGSETGPGVSMGLGEVLHRGWDTAPGPSGSPSPSLGALFGKIAIPTPFLPTPVAGWGNGGS